MLRSLYINPLVSIVNAQNRNSTTVSTAARFEKVFEMYGKELVIVGTCITHLEVHYFSKTTTPAMSVREAVRISMSIPLFFEPVLLGDHVFVDGGVTDNFPLSVFDTDHDDYDNAYRAPVNVKTLGFFLAEDKTHNFSVRKINGLKDFVGCLLDSVKLRIANLAIKPGDELRTIFIQTRHISSTQFSISDQEKDLLFHEGQSAARKFFGLKQESSPDVTHRGRLIVRLVEGVNLNDSFLPTDPYCVVSLGDDVRKSSTRYKTLHPVWKEIFVFKVADVNEPLKLQVFDFKFLRAPKLLGSKDIPISTMQEGVPTEMWITLEKEKKSTP